MVKRNYRIPDSIIRDRVIKYLENIFNVYRALLQQLILNKIMGL